MGAWFLVSISLSFNLFVFPFLLISHLLIEIKFWRAILLGSFSFFLFKYEILRMNRAWSWIFDFVLYLAAVCSKILKFGGARCCLIGALWNKTRLLWLFAVFFLQSGRSGHFVPNAKIQKFCKLVWRVSPHSYFHILKLKRIWVIFENSDFSKISNFREESPFGFSNIFNISALAGMLL